ncbi:hypothetical protein Trichorick_01406 (plasmid) [Candidatus Trichorickettsia mobilis]|uniref:Uncharacterized protein n=1 Tax=Candidatus Trichorickettsia mobilis TaxID=1346319 RepID=A0ABZ0UWT5_9RICK|nr:hypothetical protein [Candidatus Trichorickettsia mobilis]WPY01493.1 hypothetical protein Trichorick_01406 [Candidatus Trichorickettsia mobilis]
MKALKLEAGVYMDSKEELLEAIEHYDVLTKKQRQVLRVLADIEIDNIATVTAVTLADMAGVTPGAIYKAVKVFEEEGLLKNIDNMSSRKIYKFRVNPIKLDQIKEVYKSKKKYIKVKKGVDFD